MRTVARSQEFSVQMVIRIEGKPEVSDIATAIFTARIRAANAEGWPDASLAFFKKKAIEDATFVWEFLRQRGWQVQPITEDGEIS